MYFTQEPYLNSCATCPCVSISENSLGNMSNYSTNQSFWTLTSTELKAYLAAAGNSAALGLLGNEETAALCFVYKSKNIQDCKTTFLLEVTGIRTR